MSCHEGQLFLLTLPPTFSLPFHVLLALPSSPLTMSSLCIVEIQANCGGSSGHGSPRRRGLWHCVQDALSSDQHHNGCEGVCVCGGGGGCRDYSIVSFGVADKYCRLGNFHVRNVCMFNFRHMAKWRKLNARVRNFHAFNFRHLSNC